MQDPESGRLVVGPSVANARGAVYTVARALITGDHTYTATPSATAIQLVQAVDALIEAAWEEGRPDVG